MSKEQMIAIVEAKFQTLLDRMDDEPELRDDVDGLMVMVEKMKEERDLSFAEYLWLSKLVVEAQSK